MPVSISGHVATLTTPMPAVRSAYSTTSCPSSSRMNRCRRFNMTRGVKNARGEAEGVLRFLLGELAVDRRPLVRHPGADGGDGGNRNDRDRRRDQAVLDHVLTGLFLHQTLQQVLHVTLHSKGGKSIAIGRPVRQPQERIETCLPLNA